MKALIEVLKNNPNGAYDFMANNYYKYSKEELNNVIKELLYAIHTNTTEKEHDKILNDVADEVADQNEL